MLKRYADFWHILENRRTGHWSSEDVVGTRRLVRSITTATGTLPRVAGRRRTCRREFAARKCIAAIEPFHMSARRGRGGCSKSSRVQRMTRLWMASPSGSSMLAAASCQRPEMNSSGVFGDRRGSIACERNTAEIPAAPCIQKPTKSPLSA
jgi:hypothetical protein